MSKGGKKAIRSDEARPAAERRELKKRIRELERVLGKKTLENEILTKAVKANMSWRAASKGGAVSYGRRLLVRRMVKSNINVNRSRYTII